jgi:hypothetical protein
MDKYVRFVISLEIRGYKLNEQEISDVLKLQSSEFYNDSSMKLKFGKTKEDIWSHNLWCYEQESNYEEFDLMCDRFLRSIQNVKRLSDLETEISDVRLHLMINSQLAQIHAFLSAKFFGKIAELGLPMDVNIISFGYVEDEID